MIADGVRDTDLGAYQRAARTLLVHPLVTRMHPNADALTLVRRFAVQLARDLDSVAGYRLELSPTCARLVKRLDRLDATQGIQLPGKRPFDRRRYAYLSLVLGALGRAGTQVALTELADALRRRAAEIDGLGFDPDEYRHRLAFVDVVLHLERLGVLSPLEVSGITWLKDPEAGDALYDVDRDAAHALFVPPRVMQHVGSVTALLSGELSASRDARRAAARQRLGRLLLENPVVYLDDLAEADRLYLRNQARSLAADLDQLTGGQLERRAEGVALVDATGGFTDRRFPTGGTPAQVALLLADAIADAVGDGARHGDGDGDNGAVGHATVPAAAAAGAELAARLDAARPEWPGHLEPVDVSTERTAPYAGAADDVQPERTATATPPHDPTGDTTPARPTPPAHDSTHDDAQAAPTAAAAHDPADDTRPARTTATPHDPTQPARATAPLLDPTDEVDPAPGGAGGEPYAPPADGPLLTDAWLNETIGRFVASHGNAFAGDLRDDPAALRAAAVDVLAAFDLVRPVPGGLVARPAISRFRDVRVETAPSPQLSLLDDGGPR
jgi:uncharacterized protein (TIGR02678 family)